MVNWHVMYSRFHQLMFFIIIIHVLPSLTSLNTLSFKSNLSQLRAAFGKGRPNYVRFQEIVNYTEMAWKCVIKKSLILLKNLPNGPMRYFFSGRGFLTVAAAREYCPIILSEKWVCPNLPPGSYAYARLWLHSNVCRSILHGQNSGVINQWRGQYD